MTRFAMAAAALLMALSSSPAAAQTDEPTRAEILDMLGSGHVPADYIVLLDTSGSMAEGNRYATAVQALGGLFEALPAEDRVALYTFDSSVNPEYQGPRLPSPELIGKLPPAPNPTGSTDLGKAMSVALEELQRNGAAQVANVVIITDGAHDPAPGSPYADPAGPAWEALRQQAKQKAASTLSVYVVPLGDGSSGAAAVKSVFDSTIVLAPGDMRNLREYLNRSKARVEIEKARTVLSGDIGRSLETKWKIEPGDDGRAEVVVTLTSTAKHLPVDVENVRMEVGNKAIGVTISQQRHRIEPGKSVDITGFLSYQPKGDMLMRRTVAEETTISLRATVRSSWTAALKPEIDLAVDRELTAGSDPVTLSRTVGSSLFLPGFGVLVLVLVVLTVFLRRRRRDVLDGTLIISTGVESSELARFKLSGSKTVLDGRGLPGRGAVMPDRPLWGKCGADLKISYTNAPDARPPVTGRCRSGGSLILGGLYFSHLKNGD